MIYQFLALLVVHWIADFVLQTHWQASNKSKNNIALGQHVLTYTIAFFFTVPFIFNIEDNLYKQWLIFIAINGILHFVTDYFTSRVSSKLFGDWHNFFVVIGLDQLIHQFTLGLTMLWIFK